jgi:hypothetical protein
MRRLAAGTRWHPRITQHPTGSPVGTTQQTPNLGVNQAPRWTQAKSAVSRRFVAQTAKALLELLGRDLTGLPVACLMIDGICMAEHCCVVALAILADGTKLAVLSGSHLRADGSVGRTSPQGRWMMSAACTTMTLPSTW